MVVLSGGQDSTTCLLEAVLQRDRGHYSAVHAVTFNYGQRHSAELLAAQRVAKIVGADSHTICDVPGILRGRSPLVNSSVSLERYTDPESMEATIGDRIELTFVPFRNPFFLIIAANLAASVDCYDLITGVCAMDNANYPDCTPMFVVQMESLLNEALTGKRAGMPWFTVHAPLLYMDKASTVRLAMQHGSQGSLALAVSHTCYDGSRPPCGTCHACVLREDGFVKAGVGDPLRNADDRAAAEKMADDLPALPSLI